MTARSTMMPFPAQLRTSLQIDPVLLTIVMTLLLGGLVILTSASITISDNVTGNPFYYVERQLLAAAIGGVVAFVCLFVPMRLWQSLGPLLLLSGFALLSGRCCSRPPSNAHNRRLANHKVTHILQQSLAVLAYQVRL